jgi:phosphatidylglycerol---prolipoprotein diacylglyceryl transferase
MIGYGIGRFFIESLRTDQLVIKGIGIAISQVVSIILIIVGITIIIRNRCKLRRDMKQSIQEN